MNDSKFGDFDMETRGKLTFEKHRCKRNLRAARFREKRHRVGGMFCLKPTRKKRRNLRFELFVVAFGQVPEIVKTALWIESLVKFWQTPWPGRTKTTKRPLTFKFRGGNTIRTTKQNLKHGFENWSRVANKEMGTGAQVYFYCISRVSKTRRVCVPPSHIACMQQYIEQISQSRIIVHSDNDSK